MQIKIICIGKLKNKNLISEIEDLKKRISRIEIIELKEIKDKNTDIIKNKEFDLIKGYLNKSCYNVLLWEFGDEFTTKEFHERFKDINKTVQFIITGPFGPNEELKNNVDLRLSLSKMTFTHEQALYLLIEQLYRTECISKNIPYNK